VRKIINQLARKPKILFLIDGLGAMLTGVLLFVVLRNFSEYFGMPLPILTFLSAIAAIFFVYSFTCFFFLTNNWILYIRAISVGNLLYSCITISQLLANFELLTLLGWIYFIGEIIVIGLLVYIELSVAIEIRKRQRVGTT